MVDCGAGEGQRPPGEYWRVRRFIRNDADAREISKPQRLWREVKNKCGVFNNH